ncbi:hypothetical protein JCM11641_003878 [Rhodosporidiobolus odoratus]
MRKATDTDSRQRRRAALSATHSATEQISETPPLASETTGSDCCLTTPIKPSGGTDVASSPRPVRSLSGGHFIGCSQNPLTFACGPSQADLPIELLAKILLDPALSLADRSACCLASKTFSSLVRPSIIRKLELRICLKPTVTDNLYDGGLDYGICQVHDKRYHALINIPELARQVEEVSVRETPDLLLHDAQYTTRILERREPPSLDTLLAALPNFSSFTVRHYDSDIVEAALFGHVYQSVTRLYLSAFSPRLIGSFPSLKHLILDDTYTLRQDFNPSTDPAPPGLTRCEFTGESVNYPYGLTHLLSASYDTLTSLHIQYDVFPRRPVHESAIPTFSLFTALRSLFLKVGDIVSRSNTPLVPLFEQNPPPSNLTSLSILQDRNLAQRDPIGHLPLTTLIEVPPTLHSLILDASVFHPVELAQFLLDRSGTGAPLTVNNRRAGEEWWAAVEAAAKNGDGKGLQRQVLKNLGGVYWPEEVCKEERAFY